ncbi:MAG: tyrosine-type recombinase/integrase, partial [Thermomicrobiales bacterium]|nr:tyrosine-type recombinase/integrase [Thermomicrobiales bacterium]
MPSTTETGRPHSIAYSGVRKTCHAEERSISAQGTRWSGEPRSFAALRMTPLPQGAVALTPGTRQSKILGLRWQDVDLGGRTLRVRQTLQRVGKELAIKEPKTERSRRTLALSASLVAALTAHKDRQALERAKAGARWQETGLVFTSTTGTALDARNLTREFKRHLKSAGL